MGTAAGTPQRLQLFPRSPRAPTAAVAQVLGVRLSGVRLTVLWDTSGRSFYNAFGQPPAEQPPPPQQPPLRQRQPPPQLTPPPVAARARQAQ